jgi:quercetin dioxygenase-like cupin family protein
VHRVGRLGETEPSLDPFSGRSEGHARYPLVDRAAGSPHQAVTVAELAPGGSVERHVQAFEEAIYVLEGTLAIEVAEGAETLVADDYCFIERGVPHSLANPAGEGVRWLEIAAPQPGAEMIDDTIFVAEDFRGELPEPSFVRGHFDASKLPPPSSVLGLAGFGAANVGGASLEVLVNREFGASQFHLMVVEYAPGGFITEHDHAFEEAFFFVSGKIDAVLDGETYTLRAGDYCWSGVESRHAFANRGAEPVRWLETQVPQPPSRHQARFKADWERMLSTISVGS